MNISTKDKTKLNKKNIIFKYYSKKDEDHICTSIKG